VWGRLRRTGVGGVSIAAEEAWDLAALAVARREGRLQEILAARRPQPKPAPEPPRKMWHASGGSSGW
jgi:hypothetical protein